jgi:Tfp pilus assembly protein PilP
LKKTLQKDLEDFVSEIRKSLKDNVSKVSKGREKMLMMLNTFTMIENPQEAPLPQKKNNQNNNNLIPPTGRKIIF